MCVHAAQEREGVVECLSHASKSVPAIIKKANNYSRNLMAFSGSPAELWHKTANIADSCKR